MHLPSAAFGYCFFATDQSRAKCFVGLDGRTVRSRLFLIRFFLRCLLFVDKPTLAIEFSSS